MNEIERLEDYDLRKLGIPFTLQPKGMWRLDPTARRMYDLIMDFQEPIQENRDEGTWDYIGKCTLSNREMADILEVEIRTVRRGLTRLEEFGLVTTTVIRGETIRYINNRPARNMQLGVEKHLEDIGSSRHFLSKSYWKAHKDEYEKDNDPFSGQQIAENKETPTLASEATINGVGVDYFGLARTFNINSKNTHISSAGQRVEAEQNDQGSGGLLAFSPAGAIPSPYSPPQLTTETTYDSELANIEIPAEIVKGSQISMNASKKLKGAGRLRADPASANSRDVIAYFDEAFTLKYHRPCITNSMNTPQLRSIISNGFMNKYPYSDWQKLIDGLIELYLDLPISRDKYPYPSVRCLTQPWLMGLVSAALNNRATRDELKHISDKAKEISATRVKFTEEFLDYVEEHCGGGTVRQLMNLRDLMVISSLNPPNWLNRIDIPGDRLKELIDSVRMPA